MSAWQSIDAFLERKGIRFGKPTPGQTTGGRHATNSLHYDNRARDYGRSNSDVSAITAALLPFAKGPSPQVIELFDSVAGVFYKNGAAITPSASLRQGHYSHVHAALAAGATPLDEGNPPPKRNDVPAGTNVALQLVGGGRNLTERFGAVILEGIGLAAASALVALGLWSLATRKVT